MTFIWISSEKIRKSKTGRCRSELIRSKRIDSVNHRSIHVQTDDGPASLDVHWEEDMVKSLRLYHLRLQLNGVIETHMFSTRMLSLEDLQSDIATANLKIQDVYGDLDKSPWGPESAWVIVKIGMSSGA